MLFVCYVYYNGITHFIYYDYTSQQLSDTARSVWEEKKV